MKKNIIALLGATLILFVWQSLSWMLLPVHKDFAKYTPAETEIMTVLNSNLSETGAYRMPGSDPSKPQSMEEMEQLGKSWVGKPYAMVFYNKEFKGMQAATMLTGVFFNMIAIMVAIMMVNMAIRGGASSGKRFLVVLSMSVFCIFQGAMLNWNWMDFPWHFIKGEVVDMLAGWTLCGLFLSWYLGRGEKVVVV